MNNSSFLDTKIRALRTKKLELRRDREPKTDNFCVVCHRDIKGSPRFWVHCIDGELRALHPEDEHLYEPNGGDLGFHPLGPGCARRIGLEWLHDEGANQ